MNVSILTICYLIGSVTFILGLKMLSHPAKARNGNLIAAAGMLIAIIGTIFLYEEDGVKLGNYGWIFGGLTIGTVVGVLAAKKVKMTAMPEMVSLFNGMGGACAALISIVEFNHLYSSSFQVWKCSICKANLLVHNFFTGELIIIFAGLVIGSVSFA